MQSGSNSIVGSNSKDSSGEFVSKENGFKLSDPHNRRLKRLIDIIDCFCRVDHISCSIVTCKKTVLLFWQLLCRIFAQKTWIGYAAEEKNLPRFRKAVIACNGIPVSVKQQLPVESLQMVDYWYARDYTPITDLKLLKRVYRNLGG